MLRLKKEFKGMKYSHKGKHISLEQLNEDQIKDLGLESFYEEYETLVDGYSVTERPKNKRVKKNLKDDKLN